MCILPDRPTGITFRPLVLKVFGPRTSLLSQLLLLKTAPPPRSFCSHGLYLLIFTIIEIKQKNLKYLFIQLLVDLKNYMLTFFKLFFYGKTQYFPKQKKISQKGGSDSHNFHIFLMTGLKEDNRFSYLLRYGISCDMCWRLWRKSNLT